MDEQTAWACFVQTGSVQDYLRYVSCKDSVQGTGKEEAGHAEPDPGRGAAYIAGRGE